MTQQQNLNIFEAFSQFEKDVNSGYSALDASACALSIGLGASTAAVVMYDPKSEKIDTLSKHISKNSEISEIDFCAAIKATLKSENQIEDGIWQKFSTATQIKTNITTTAYLLHSTEQTGKSFLICFHEHHFECNLISCNFLAAIALLTKNALSPPALPEHKQLKAVEPEKPNYPENDTHFHELLEVSPNAIVVQSLGKVVYINRRALSVFAAEKGDQLLGREGLDFIVPEEREKILAYRNQVIDGTSDHLTIETKHVRLNGHIFQSEISIASVTWAGHPATINIIRDITVRKNAEATILRRDVELKMAQEVAHLGHWRLDPATDSLEWSDELYRIYGLDPKTTTITRPVAKKMKISTDGDLFLRMQNEIAQDAINHSFEYRIRRADGEIRTLLGIAKPEFDKTGKLVALFGVSTDITEQKELEIARDASNERLKDLAELGADWLWEMDEELRFSYFSDTIHRITGQPTEFYIGRTREELNPKEVLDDSWTPHLEDLENHRPFKNFRYKHYSETGKLYHWAISGKPIYDKNGNFKGYRGIGFDRTGEVNMEEKLIQAQKMEAVGQLTGGVAHDFNNLLAVIQGNLLRMTTRGAELTQSMLAFSRKQELHPKSFQLNEQIYGMIKILQSTLGETISIKVQCDEDLWACSADPGQVENALLNLALNARDSMPDGGSLTIETRNVYLDDDYAGAQTELEPGNYLMLAVSDTGTGIPAEALQHVFEPFYTTKETGKGTGLGLSMIYGFAKQSGGHANIYSEPGHGTTAKIYLPRSEVIAEVISPEKYTGVKSEDKTILVVEDDIDMRTLAVALLSSMGFTIREAKDGPSALNSIDIEGPVDLLLTDVVLPGGLNGVELSSKINVQYPSIKTLFMSGYTEDAFSENKLLKENAVLLHKPFRKADLADKIQQVLDTHL